MNKWDGIERRNSMQLRVAVEARLAHSSSKTEIPIRPAEELLHVLQVHQIELEMQNENLRQTQLALEESRDRYIDLYDFAPVAYLTLDDKGMISEINLTGARLLGVERNKLLNTRFTRFVALEYAERWHAHFMAAFKNHNTSHCELLLQRGDASVFLVHLDCLHMETGNGAHSVRVVLTDFSERNRAETLLRESEEKLRVIFEGTLDGILLADAQTRQFSSGNSAICRMLGYSHEELMRLRVSDIHPLPDLPHVIEQFEALLHGKARLAENIPVKRKNGSVFYADVTAVPVTIGDKVNLVGIFRDITERKQAEEIRRISALKHQMLFESARDALMTLAPPFWKFTGANEATLKLFGVSSVAEFIAHAPWEVSPERQPDGRLSREKAQEMIATAMRAGAHSFEWEHQRLNGEPFTADVLLTKMELGEELFLQATVRDITERRRTEIRLGEYHQLLRELAAQGAAAREAESKRIAREVHDELGQLLTALRMDISLLRIQFGEHDPLLMSKIQNMLVLVDKSIQGVRNVTANLRPVALDMGIIPAIAWLCDEFPDRANTVCTLRVVDEPVGLDDARTVALFRIVQESLTNIARHAQATHVEITVKQCGEDITLEVHDDGKGFDSAAKLSKKSFGLLGMRERAIALGGKVEIASAPSKGTVVSVHIPIFQTHPGRRIND